MAEDVCMKTEGLEKSAACKNTAAHVFKTFH